jgi:hypothetical protein
LLQIEQIRRINRLWASDSLFLKEFLLIPVRDNSVPLKTSEPPPVVSPTQISSPISNSSFDEDNVEDFLEKIDASIATQKRKSRGLKALASNFLFFYYTSASL